MKAMRVFAGGIACVAAVVALAAAGFATSAHATSGTSTATSFTDPAGDAGGAPDIAAVSITDDYASGTVRITVTANGVSTINGASEPETHVFVDVDKNSSTGYKGIEYDILYWRTASDWGWDVDRWNGSAFDELNSQTLSFSRSGDVLTWELNRADLGGTTGFAFSVLSPTWANGEITAADRAPDAGMWTYDLSAAPAPTTTPTPASAVKPVIGAPGTTPASAMAGKRFTVSFPVTRSDTGASLMSGTMICDPSVQGRVITHAESFSGGTARLAFTIPKTAKGKVLKVKVTIKVGNQATTKVATFNVR